MDQKLPEEHQHQLKDLERGNIDNLVAEPKWWKKLTWSIWASQKSFPKIWTEIPGLAAKGKQAPELQKTFILEMIQDHYLLCTWTCAFTDGSAENAVRNGGSGTYVHLPDGTTSSLSIPACDLSSNNSRTPCPESCHRTPNRGRLQPAEYCPAHWLPICSQVSHDWPHWPFHLAATPQLKHPVPQQGPMGPNTCWHCHKLKCKLAKAATKLLQPHLSTPLTQKSRPFRTEAVISLETKKQKGQINTLDRRTQTTIFCLCTGHCGLRRHQEIGSYWFSSSKCGSEEQTSWHILQTCLLLQTISKVLDQNGISRLNNMLDTYHSGPEPSICKRLWSEDTQLDSKI